MTSTREIRTPPGAPEILPARSIDEREPGEEYARRLVGKCIFTEYSDARTQEDAILRTKAVLTAVLSGCQHEEFDRIRGELKQERQDSVVVDIGMFATEAAQAS